MSVLEPTKNDERKALDQQVQEYLAKGGKISRERTKEPEQKYCGWRLKGYYNNNLMAAKPKAAATT